MSEELKQILETLSITKAKPPKGVFKEPNSVDKWYGKDNPKNCTLESDQTGKDLYTNHIAQSDKSSLDFKYHWNSLGFRGPEPDYDAKNKILVLGGSLSLGTGVALEDSFPDILAKELDANYINLSGADALAELIDPILRFKNYNPNYVVISDTRFVNTFTWALLDIYNSRATESMPAYQKLFKQTDTHTLKMFDYFLKGLFPNATLIMAACERREWKRLPKFDNLVSVPFEKELVVDLARDNMHPGPQSHKNFANKIIAQLRDL